MTNFLQVTSFDPLIVSEPQGPQGPQGQSGPPGPAGGVISIDGQIGAVDLSGNYASLDSPALTGTPTLNGAAIASTDDALAYAVVFGGM